MARLFEPASLANLPIQGRVITATDKFLGKSSVVTYLWQNSQNPQFGANVPAQTAFLKGRKVKTIERSGTAGNYTYSLSATETWDNNSVKVLLDYLLSDQYGPQGLTWEKDIHHESWYTAQEIADVVVEGAGIQTAQMNSDIPQWMPMNGDLVVQTSGGMTFQQFGTANGTDKFSGSSTDKAGLDPKTVFAKFESSISLKRYTFDGLIPSGLNYLDARNRIMDTMPGAVFFQDNEGKLRLSLPDAGDSRSHAKFLHVRGNQAAWCWTPSISSCPPTIRERTA